MNDFRTNMKVKVSTKQQILGVIVLVTILVGAVGIFTYSQFSDVVSKVSETTKGDPAISKARNVLFTISQAENQIRRYTLTEDSVHLQEFNLLREETNVLLSELKTLEPIVAGSIEIDTFENLVKSRFEILTEIALIQDAFRVEEAFKNVNASIDQAKNIPATETKGLRNLFKRTAKKKKEQEEADRSKVDQNIREIQQNATSKEEQQVKHELELLIADNKNSLALQTIVDEIVLTEKKTNLKKVDEVAALVKRTNLQVIIFCGVICLLLILTTITILNYIRRNSAFRLMLSRAKNEAESLANAKALFVATVSHEIRTPINIISGFSEQLSETKLNAEQKEHLTGIKQSSSHLLDLVNSVLDFTKLENNVIELEKKSFSPNELISTTTSLLSTMTAENEVQLELTIAEDLPEVLIGDPFRLRQVLLNIIGNAIKFTRGGKVEISFGSVETPNASVLLNITVQDNGIGMTPEELKTVFDEFVQANTSTTRLYGGTGLGLPITKKLIELQGGTLNIESEEGVGTTVHIEVPLELGELDQLESQTHGNEKIDLSNKKILVVDDEPFNRKLIRSILNKQNASIIEAVDGREAISFAVVQSFDLILMDIQMPLVDGIEASKEIKAHNKDIPIISVSASGSPEDLERYKLAGMENHLGKPYKQSQLLHKIGEVLSIPIELIDDEPEVETTENAIKEKEDHISFVDLKQMSDGDTQFYFEMLETFENSTREGVQKIEAAANESNWVKVGELAHRICAPCKHLSANSLYRYLKRLEENCLTDSNLDEVPSLLEYVRKESIRVLEIVQNERLSSSK